MEERNDSGMPGSSPKPSFSTKEKSLLDKAGESIEKNRHLIWGGCSLFVGFYLLAKTYMLFVQIAVSVAGAILILYGLSELRVTSLKQLYRNIVNKLS